jgi:hypothetical protein
VPVDYFDNAMERLHAAYLNVPFKAALRRLSKDATRAAKDQQVLANKVGW